MAMDIFVVMNDKELNERERLIASLIIFYEELTKVQDLSLLGDIKEATEKMYHFLEGGDTYKNKKVVRNLVDWKNDEFLICSAINKVAGYEIRSVDYLHWWTFLSMYTAIGDCPLSTIISIRRKLQLNEKLEKFEQKFVRECPEYFNMMNESAKEEADDLYNEILRFEGKL